MTLYWLQKLCKGEWDLGFTGSFYSNNNVMAFLYKIVLYAIPFLTFWWRERLPESAVIIYYNIPSWPLHQPRRRQFWHTNFSHSGQQIPFLELFVLKSVPSSSPHLCMKVYPDFLSAKLKFNFWKISSICFLVWRKNFIKSLINLPTVVHSPHKSYFHSHIPARSSTIFCFLPVPL